MKIKKLFELLAAYNKLCNAMTGKIHYFKVYFDEWDLHEFKNFKEFMKYLKDEYIGEYIITLLNIDGQETLEHSHSYAFSCGGYKHTVDFYLY